MGFTSLNIHVEIHKIHIEGNAISIGNFNLLIIIFQSQKFQN
jgi:hypothetical protein